MIKALSIGAASRALEKAIKQHAKAVEVGSVRALNKTASSVRVIAGREIKKTLNVRKSAISKTIGIGRATKTNYRSDIRSVYQPILLENFIGTRQTKKGVSAKMRKDKPRILFKGAWIHKKGAHFTHGRVFRRKGRNRLPIKKIYGPSVHALFGEKIDKLVALGDPILEKNLDHEIAFALSK